MREIVLSAALLLAWPWPQATQAADLNPEMTEAVNAMLADPNRKDTKYGQGWYGQELVYGNQKIHPENAPLRMCNAAVTEVIIEAVTLYASKHPAVSLQTAAPSEDWEKRGWHQLKPHLGLMDYVPEDAISDAIKDRLPNKKIPSPEIRKAFADFGKNGSMGRALERLGLGKAITFEKLKPGDVVTFDREKTDAEGNKKYPGHSAVFLAYLDDNQKEITEFNAAKPSKIKGFKYYSSQGSAKEGLGLRWAYFKGFCPKKNGDVAPSDKTEVYCPDPLTSKVEISGDYARDCCVQRPAKDALMGGRVDEPASWTYATVKEQLRTDNKVLRERLKAYLNEYLGKQEKLIATVRGRLDAYSSHYAALVDSIPTATNGFATQARKAFSIDSKNQSEISALSDGQVLALDPLMPGRLKRALDLKLEASEVPEGQRDVDKIKALLQTLDAVPENPRDSPRFDGETID